MDSKSIVRVLKALKIAEYTPGTRNVYCTCPLAPWRHPNGRDSRPSMSIKVDPIGDSVVMCWSSACGWTGTLTQLTKMVNHFTVGQYDEAVQLAETLERSDLQARLDAVLNPEPEDEEEKLFDESMLKPFAGRVPRYALNRGLTIDTCKYWELGYDEFRARLVVPVRNTDGDLVGMMGRSIDDSQSPKWYGYWNFRKGNYLYGEHKVDQSIGRVVVVEGMPDVWMPHQYGYRNVLALMGGRVTFGQQRKLLRWGLPIYWLLDGDDAGKMGTSQCVGMMRGQIKQYVATCPKDKDPGDMTKEETDKAISEAEFVL